MKRAIVLSGGGAKGAYQIGVWKALRKLHIKYDIVTGTSVGAINGALMVQKDYLKSLEMWEQLNFNLVFDNELQKDYNTKEGKKEVIKMYAKNILLNGGMDISKLEQTIEEGLDSDKFYNSKIDYGLVVVELSSFKQKTLTKKEISKDKLKDYIIGSATIYPAFKKKQIEDKTFIDGGYYDNLPINLAIDMGAEEIIAIDLNSFGIKQKVKDKDIKITYIQPRNDLGPILFFYKDTAQRNIRFGYNDTMKTFNKLAGDKYTFKHNHLKRNLNRYQDEFVDLLKSIFKDSSQPKKIWDKIISIARYSDIINGNKEKAKEIINQTLEYAGKILEVDPAKIYKIKKYNKLLIDKLSNVEDLSFQVIEEKIKSNNIKGLLNRRYVIKYFYNILIKMKESPNVKKELGSLSIIMSKEFLSAVYIYIINKNI